MVPCLPEPFHSCRQLRTHIRPAYAAPTIVAAVITLFYIQKRGPEIYSTQKIAVDNGAVTSAGGIVRDIGGAAAKRSDDSVLPVPL